MSLCLLTAGCRQHLQQSSKASQSPEQTYQAVRAFFIRGDLSAAHQLATEATRRYLYSDPLWAARFRVEVARVLLYQGYDEDAAALLKAAAPRGEESTLAVRRNLLLAIAEARLEQPRLAANAIAVAEAADSRTSLHAEILGAQGNIALQQDRLADAESFFKAALNLGAQQETKFFELQMWMNLGVVALHLEHYEDALERFNHASTLATSLGARLALEKVLGNLGWTYYSTGDFARALDNSRIAASQAAAIGASLDEVQWLKNAGMSQYQNHDLFAAQASFDQSLKIAETLQNVEETIGAHVALAFLLLPQHATAAEPHIREAVRLTQLRQADVADREPDLLEALLFASQGQTEKAEAKLVALLRESSIRPSLQWEAENTLANVYAKEGRDRDSELWFQRAIATFHQQRLTLRSVELELPFLENGNDLYLSYMEHLIHKGRTDEALTILDSSRAEALAEGLGTSAATTAKLKQTSRPSPRALAARLDATILVYCLRLNTSYLWVVTRNRADFYTLPGSAVILPLVARHTQAILTSKDLLTQKDDTGQQLYNALVQPAERTIGLGTRGSQGGRVFLIADKGLGGLNFETLIPPGDKPHYWIEDVILTNARSLRLLAATKKVMLGPHKLLLVGDPLYRAEEFPALPNAAAEMTGVAAHFTPDTRSVSSGPNASPSTYTAGDPGKFAYIHFVAHATANETNPLDSAIILSTPPNTPGDRPAANRLYARDILLKPLEADLVTISSCYGSGTRNYSGEGVVGLVWAFLRAGAHSVIGASWEVSDVSTPQLMNGLYTRLLSGDRPDEALRAGKLAMIRGSGIYRKPLYWASFQLYAGR